MSRTTSQIQSIRFLLSNFLDGLDWFDKINWMIRCFAHPVKMFKSLVQTMISNWNYSVIYGQSIDIMLFRECVESGRIQPCALKSGMEPNQYDFGFNVPVFFASQLFFFFLYCFPTPQPNNHFPITITHFPPFNKWILKEKNWAHK